MAAAYTSPTPTVPRLADWTNSTVGDGLGGDPGGTWEIGQNGPQSNIWNSSRNDGSVPWDVSMQYGLPPGAMYGAGGGSGSSSRIYGNTGSDAYLNAALDRLRGTVTGANLPFDAATKANMLSQAGDMNAAAEASNASDLRARAAANGGGANDPATQAALAALKSTRQQGNMSAAQGIETRANQANFAAQEGAAGQLSSTRLNQAQVDPYYNGAPNTFTGTSWGPGGGGAGSTAGPAGPNGSTGMYGSGGGTSAPGTSGGAAGPNFSAQSPALALAYQQGYRPSPTATDWRTQWQQAHSQYLAGRHPSTGAYGWQPVNGAGFNTGAGNSSTPR